MDKNPGAGFNNYASTKQHIISKVKLSFDLFQQMSNYTIM